MRNRFDTAMAQELRRKAISILHRHYIENIPVYRKLTGEENCIVSCDVETIREKLMLSSDIFKSYEQEWLDVGDFNMMNRWLSNIYHKRINTDMTGVDSIDRWIDRLDTAVYMSSTLGDIWFFFIRTARP